MNWTTSSISFKLPRALILVAVYSGYYTALQVAGLERFKPPIANRMEEEKGLLANSFAVVVENIEGPGSLLSTECLGSEASCHHLTHNNQVKLIVGQLGHLTSH